MSRGTVLVVEGTGVSTLLEAVTDRLDPELWDHQIVDYPAEYGMAGSYAASRDIGTANLVDAIAAQKARPVALLGYSQGAQIVGDTAELVASTGYDPLADVRAVALVSDPMRPAGKSIGGLGTGYGIAGQRDIVADFPSSGQRTRSTRSPARSTTRCCALSRTSPSTWPSTTSWAGRWTCSPSWTRSAGRTHGAHRVCSTSRASCAVSARPRRICSATCRSICSATAPTSTPPAASTRATASRPSHPAASPTAAGSLTSSTRSERPCDHPR
ncbi:PE-PPE domain-containing protein [Rhodococcus hoagii]|nr:PE-PPE domain-containing protein [Prescottella equi]